MLGITYHCDIARGEYVGVVKGPEPFLALTWGLFCLEKKKINKKILQQLLLGTIVPFMERNQELIWPRVSQLGVSITVPGGLQNEAGVVLYSQALREQPKSFGKGC